MTEVGVLLNEGVTKSMNSISNLKGEALATAIDVAVLKKGFDAQKIEGQAAVELIEESGDVAPPKRAAGQGPHLGQLIDIYV
jgi:hypothetical protein